MYNSTQMSRNRFYDKGLTASVRVAVPVDCSDGVAKRIAAKFDVPLRSARSLERFVVRAEPLPGRREVLVTIAALRRDSTDRADSSILTLLRRAVPEIEKRVWARLPADLARNQLFKAESVYADYSIVADAAASAQMETLLLKPASGGSNAFVSSTEVPPAL